MKQRTTKQNRSLHKYFELLSEALNDAGYDVKKTLKADFEIDWSPVLIKEIIFKPVMKAKYAKKSTTDLSSGELQIMYDELNRYIGNKFGVFVPFPSEEQMLEEDKKNMIAYPEGDYDDKVFDDEII